MEDAKKRQRASAQHRLIATWVVGIGVGLGALPAAVLADEAQDIQALKDQVRALQQQLNKMSTPQTTGTVAAPAPVNQATEATDERKRRETPSLTYAGITLYGTVDMGIAYLSHGAPLSSNWGPGLPYFVQNYSNHSITSIAGNGLSQSKVGLSGVEPLFVGDWPPFSGWRPGSIPGRADWWTDWVHWLRITAKLPRSRSRPEIPAARVNRFRAPPTWASHPKLSAR
jgi:hypothetical protein